MILICDLDDTLYDELTYVRSGFRAVAGWLHGRFGWSAEDSLATMTTLERQGRGLVFDRLLERHGVLSKALVRDCVRVYRQHRPAIALFPAARRLLDATAGAAYLVTDGHKIVQHKKIQALGIEARFKKIFITHRYGIRHAKPSIHCFEIIRKLEGCAWQDLAYVGDNPAKDFVNLNPLGVMTIRVLSGIHKDAQAQCGFDARYTLRGLHELPTLLKAHAR